MLPAHFSLLPAILQASHSSPVAGHMGSLRTSRHIAQDLYWAGMKKQVKEFINSYPMCPTEKISFQVNGRPQGGWFQL